MVNKIYTKEQKEILLKNKNVEKCGVGVITYTGDFKVRAVKQYNEEYMTPKEIFMQAGFDIEMIGKNKPKNCLERWNKIFRKKGLKELLESKAGGGRGGRPKGTKNLSEKDKIERLKLEIEYLKEKNRFLAKIRAKKKLN